MSCSKLGKRPSSEFDGASFRIRELSQAARHTAPSPLYLDKTPGISVLPLISERQREKVVKYINELAEDFELNVQTGTLACNYFDRYLACLHQHVREAAAKGSAVKPPTADKRLIQMVASTCLLIAAKFSDRKLPPLSELEKVHHGRAHAEEFAALELRILQGLQWKLHAPLPHVFIEHLRVLCAGAPFTSAIEDRTNFFIDLSVYGYHFLAYEPAAIAAAALLTAWKFSDESESVTCYLRILAMAVSLEPHQLSACVNALVRYYGSCFPESADKVQHAQLFVPIVPEKESPAHSPTMLREVPTPVPEQPDTPSEHRASSVPLPDASQSGTDDPSSVGPTPPKQRAGQAAKEGNGRPGGISPDDVSQLDPMGSSAKLLATGDKLPEVA